MIRQRNACSRQRILGARKETVDIDILVTSRNGDRKIMQSIRITSRPTSRKRKWNQLEEKCRTKNGPLETPALTIFSCEDFPSRTTWSRLLLRKEKVRPNIWPETPKDVSLWSRSECQALPKALDISSATAGVVPDLLKVLSILSDSIQFCEKFCSWLRRPKTTMEIRKKSTFSRWSTILLFTNFSKTLLTAERRLTGS